VRDLQPGAVDARRGLRGARAADLLHSLLQFNLAQSDAHPDETIRSHFLRLLVRRFDNQFDSRMTQVSLFIITMAHK